MTEHTAAVGDMNNDITNDITKYTLNTTSSSVVDEINALLHLDLFRLFSLEPVFSLDLTTLQYNYQELQRRFHPDNFVNMTPSLKNLSLHLSAHITDAYQTLVTPLTRASYLLKFHQIEFNLNESAAMPQQFLLNQLELREQIARANGLKNIDGLDKMLEEILVTQNGLLQNITNAFSIKDWAEVKICLKQLAFYIKLQEEINQILNNWL